jgi:hypothetical protein
MAGYPKIWASKLFIDSWYVTLSNNERGVWLQLILLAKMCGDSGEFSFRSYRHLAENMGLDSKTLAKILRDFRRVGKICLEEKDQNTVYINIPKYRYYQGLAPKDINSNVIIPTAENSPKIPPKPDQTKPDQSKEKQSGANAPSPPLVFLKRIKHNDTWHEFQKLKISHLDFDNLEIKYGRLINIAQETVAADNWLAAGNHVKKNYRAFLENWFIKSAGGHNGKFGK